MKKIFIYCALLSIILSACKKDKKSQPESADKLYPVSFDISNFNQDIEPITQNNLKTNDVVTPEQAGVVKLMYKLYDSNNTLKKTKVLRKGNPLFPSIKDSLAAGNYTGVFIGIKDTLDFKDMGTYFRYYEIYQHPGNDTPGQYVFTETFYKKINFTVSSTGIQQDVTLGRLNAELQIIFKDAIPIGTTYASVSITDYTGFLYFDGTPVGAQISHSATISIPANKIGTTNFATKPISYIYNTLNPVTVTIESSWGGGILQKTISGVQLQRNTRTILTGNVFTSSVNNAGFNVTYQPLNPNDLIQGF